MHSLRRQPLPELVVHLEQRLGHSMHLRGTNPVIHTEPYEGNEYALAHTLSVAGSLSAAPAISWNKQSYERVLCRMHWQGVFSSAALPPTSLCTPCPDIARTPIKRGPWGAPTWSMSQARPSSQGSRLRSVSAAATTMQPMATTYGACTRLTSVRYESFSTALRAAHACCCKVLWRMCR